MNSNLFSSAIEQIDKSVQEESVSDTFVINIRPGAKLSAMLEILSTLKGETVSSILFEEIPKELELLLLGYSKSHEVIFDLLTDMIDEESSRHGGDQASYVSLEEGSVLSGMEKTKQITINSPLVEKIQKLFG